MDEENVKLRLILNLCMRWAISVGTGPSSYKKRIYRAAVSQRLRNTVTEKPF